MMGIHAWPRTWRIVSPSATPMGDLVARTNAGRRARSTPPSPRSSLMTGRRGTNTKHERERGVLQHEHTDPTDLQTLLQKLDEPMARYAELDRYYTGTQAVGVPGPEAKTALGNRFGRWHPTFRGWPSPRWRNGCGSPGSPIPTCGPTGSATTSIRLSGVAHREALLLGDSLRDRVG